MSYENLKNMSYAELEDICKDIRQKIMSAVFRYGGHLSSNLGVVELTVALHRVYDVYKDRLIWDVGHQCYTHKLLTDRTLEGLRNEGGVSGFIRPHESAADVFVSGHSSTALALCNGLLRAKKLKGSKESIVAVIGDGAMTGGLFWEAFNDLPAVGMPMVIVINDNGSHSQCSMLNTQCSVNGQWPTDGGRCGDTHRASGSLWYGAPVSFHTGDAACISLREHFSVDGHNIEELERVLRMAKASGKLTFIRVRTVKGKGYPPAEAEPDRFHAVACSLNYSTAGANITHPNDKTTLSAYGRNLSADGNNLTFTVAAAEALCLAAESDSRVAVVTPSMKTGAGLAGFAKRFPDRFFDVGIAEAYAVTMAAGMAKAGMKPFVVSYSSFFQRAFDSIIHDVCIGELPVTLLIDRAGAVGGDGETHQGAFDIAYLNMMPNMTAFTPKDTKELMEMIRFSLTFNKPLAIRYPKGIVKEYNTPYVPFKWEYINEFDKNRYTIIVAGGAMLEQCSILNTQYSMVNFNYNIGSNERREQRAVRTETDDRCSMPEKNLLNGGSAKRGCLFNIQSRINIIHANTIKPLDTECLDKIEGGVVVLEEGCECGGLASAVRSYYSGKDKLVDVRSVSFPDEFIPHGEREKLLTKMGMVIDTNSLRK